MATCSRVSGGKQTSVLTRWHSNAQWPSIGAPQNVIGYHFMHHAWHMHHVRQPHTNETLIGLHWSCSAVLDGFERSTGQKRADGHVQDACLVARWGHECHAMLSLKRS
eukprot:1161834-Pelagomonas_calceolata.AAC.8